MMFHILNAHFLTYFVPLPLSRRAQDDRGDGGAAQEADRPGREPHSRQGGPRQQVGGEW